MNSDYSARYYLGVSTLLVGALTVGLATAEGGPTGGTIDAADSTTENPAEVTSGETTTARTSSQANRRRAPSVGEAPVTAKTLPKEDPSAASTSTTATAKTSTDTK
jgi:hypothetical protein